MSNRSGLLILFVSGGAAFLAIAQQTQPHMAARELFYSAAVDARPNVPRPKGTNNTPPPPPRARQNPNGSTTQPKPSQQAADPKPAKSTPPAPERSDIVHVSTAQALGLRYSILKKVDDKMVEVPADTIFHTGDRIKLRVQTNISGYLYIISQGSSGTWKPMFPSPEVEDGNNRVDGWREYTLPPASVMTFDEQKGKERIFIVFSREPENDLEKMIYSLQGGKTQPAAAPEAPPAKQIMEYAQLNIDDRTVGRLRGVYSRDLIIEKVDPNTPGERKETAVYVVNPSDKASSRVVADLNLVHE